MWLNGKTLTERKREASYRMDGVQACLKYSPVSLLRSSISSVLLSSWSIRSNYGQYRHVKAAVVGTSDVGCRMSATHASSI